jgi:hypothetical protein
MDWARNGKIAGTTGESRRIEAIQIKLEGHSDSQKEFEVTLSPTLDLHIPYLRYEQTFKEDSFLWVDLVFALIDNDNRLLFEVVGYDFLAENSSVEEEFEVTLSPSLNMHIPRLRYEQPLGEDLFLWADLAFAPIDNDEHLFFEVTDYGQ